MVEPVAGGAPAFRIQHLEVSRSARVLVLGEIGPGTRECWLALHGYLQPVEQFAGWFGPFVRSDRVIVVPEGLSRAYLDPEHTRVGASWMTKVDREAEIKDYISYLDHVVRDLGLDRLIAGARFEVHGFSQGAATAARWVVQSRPKVTKLVLWGGGLPPEITASDLDQALGDPVVLMVGREDPYLTEERVSAERSRLDGLGIRYQLISFEGGHRVEWDAMAQLSGASADQSGSDEGA